MWFEYLLNFGFICRFDMLKYSMITLTFHLRLRTFHPTYKSLKAKVILKFLSLNRLTKHLDKVTYQTNLTLRSL